MGATRFSLVNGMDTDVNTSLSSSAPDAADNLQASMGLFPGGFRRGEVRIPGLVLRVMAEGVQDGESCREFLESIVNAAVVGGVTMVILEAGGGDEQAAAGGAKLYDAACTLKALLRGRAELLVAERVDIAAAAGANGVLLSDQGLFFSFSFSLCPHQIHDDRLACNDSACSLASIHTCNNNSNSNSSRKP